jgi:inositol transport system ATP-binding protein
MHRSEGRMKWLLEACHISKSFAGIQVLNDVSFQLRPGEVHALMGENGAGKSTFAKVLSGLHRPDHGEVFVQGRNVQLVSPHAALKSGIGMVHQELLPFLDLSVAENIFMGQEPASGFFGWVKKDQLHLEADQLLARLGSAIPTRSRLRQLSVGQRQVVEIAKVLAHDSKVLILDEPTSALTDHETTGLFQIIRELKARGIGIVYISHKFDEVFKLADRITVLRDGRHVITRTAAGLRSSDLISLMVGRDLESVYPRLDSRPGLPALEVRGLSKRGRFQEVSLQVRHGEVLGIAGLMGAGRTDVLNALYGLSPADSGVIKVRGSTVRIRSTRDALRAGIGLVTEDRKQFGFVPRFGIKENLTLANLRSYSCAGFVQRRLEMRVANESVRSCGIKSVSADQAVERLSGGNQQKVVIGRTLLTDPEILMLDEPTRGIDIAAKAEVHQIIRKLVESGKSVLLVSSELQELLSLSHRILVMRTGAVVAELNAGDTNTQEILSLAIPR